MQRDVGPSAAAIKSGYIAFLDILGYQSLLLNNPLQRCVDLIRGTLVTAPQKSQSGILEAIQVKDIEIDTVQWLLLSDSVLVWQERPPGEEKDLERNRWFAFLNYLAVLCRLMFNAGLPARAAVGYGEFFIEDTCFAGHPIVEAYQVCNAQDWSGCILADSAKKYHEDLLRGADEYSALGFELLVIPYEIPFKDSDRNLGMALNWVHLPLSMVKRIGIDYHQFVLESFRAHSKSVPPSVKPKAENTELFCRHVLLNVPVDAWIEDQKGGAKAAKLIVEAAASAAKERGEAT